MALPDKRRHAILRSIFTAASVASVKADMGIAATSAIFFAVATIFATSVAIDAVPRTRATRAESVKLQHEEKAATAERDEEAGVKKDEEQSRQAERE